MSDFTSEQVERAAEAIMRFPTGLHMYWHPLSDLTTHDRRKLARAVLSAAGAPEKVAPAVDEAALAEFLKSPTHAPMETHSRADGTCSECPWPVHQLPPAELAAAVAAYLRGESK